MDAHTHTLKTIVITMSLLNDLALNKHICSVFGHSVEIRHRKPLWSTLSQYSCCETQCSKLTTKKATGYTTFCSFTGLCLFLRLSDS